MDKLYCHITDETSALKKVILGRADSQGGAPSPEDCYDPKSKEHVLKGTYPKEEDMLREVETFQSVLSRYGVEVLRPEPLPDTNQLFTRDLGFVIDEYFILSRMIEDRRHEQVAIEYILKQMPGDKIIRLSSGARVEGGDVIVHNEHVFIGVYAKSDFDDVKTARTNLTAVEELKKHFPDKIFHAFELNKSMTDPRKNALHLDCCFQPVGEKYAVIHPGGFTNEEDAQYIIDFFGKENVLIIDENEMYEMFSNFFSISPGVVVVEERQKRLIEWLEKKDLTVDKIPYYEIGKQEGLLRCSTLPLYRNK